MPIKILLNILIFFPFFSIAEYHLTGSTFYLLFLRDISIGIFLIMLLTLGVDRKLIITIPNIFAFIFIIYCFFLLFYNGISVPNIMGFRQLIMFLLLFLCGALSSQNLKNKFDINDFLQSRILILLTFSLILWIIPGFDEYKYIYTDDFRSLSYHGQGKDLYLERLYQGTTDGKYGFYRMIGDYPYERFYGPYFSPLTSGFLAFFAFILSKNDLKKYFYSTLIFLSFTRAIIVGYVIYLFITYKIQTKLLLMIIFTLLIFIIFSQYQSLIFDTSTERHLKVYEELFRTSIPFLGTLSEASVAGRYSAYSTLGESLYIALLVNSGIIGILLIIFLLTNLVIETKNSNTRTMLIIVFLIGITSEIVLSVTAYGIFWLWLGFTYRNQKS